MKKASISEAKNQLSALIDSVTAGGAVLIVDRGRPVPEREDPALSHAVHLEPLLGYLDAVFDATESWFDDIGSMALDTVPDTTRRLARKASLSVDEVPWLHRMWADKPVWWALFARMDMVEDELLDDPECLAGLQLDPANPPIREKRSTVYTYLAPEQETKLSTGDDCTRCDTAEKIGKLSFDEAERRVRLTIGPNSVFSGERQARRWGIPCRRIFE